MNKKDMELIKSLKSNEFSIGYNQFPKPNIVKKLKKSK